MGRFVHPHLVGPGDPGVPQQVGIDPMLWRRSAGAGTPVDGPQSHDSHQPLHALRAYRYPMPIQPGLHPPGPVEWGLQVLPVHLAPQAQVRFGSLLGAVGEVGTANAQQCTLPHYRQGRMLPVHHLPPLRQAMDRTSPPRNPTPASAGRSPGTTGRPGRRRSWPSGPDRCRRRRRRHR